MKPEYSFKGGKRGAVIKEEPPLEPGKRRITIRIDDDVLERLFVMPRLHNRYQHVQARENG